jgi:hypothetical protein
MRDANIVEKPLGAVRFPEWDKNQAENSGLEGEQKGKVFPREHCIDKVILTKWATP